MQAAGLAQFYLAEMEKEEINKKWGPLAYQAELSKANAPVRGIIGGNRTGKTEWGAREVYYYATNTHPYKNIGTPVECWIGTPSFDTQVESVQPKILRFIGKELLSKCHIEYYQKPKIKSITFPWGSKITFKSYEQSVDKWAGAEKRLIHFDEEPPHDIWVEANVRQGKDVPLDVIFTMTPVLGLTWFYDDIWQQQDAKGIMIKTPQWEDNPHLSREQIAQMEMMLSPEELEVRRFGRFVRNVGLVCHWWRRDVHVQDLSSFQPQGKTIWVGIDFGFSTRPTCVVFVAIDQDKLYVFDGIYERNLTTPLLVQRIREKLGGLYVTGWIADSEAPSDIAEMNKYGIPVKKVSKQGDGHWDEFRAKKLAEVGMINQFTGQSKLVVSKNLLVMQDGQMVNWFVKEVEGLFWKQVRTADGMSSRREWGDQPKDSIDALSYTIAMLPQTIENRFTSINERKALIPRNEIMDNYDI